MSTFALLGEIVNEAVYGLDPEQPIQPSVVAIRSPLAKLNGTSWQEIDWYLRDVAKKLIDHPGIEVEVHDFFVLVRKAGA